MENQNSLKSEGFAVHTDVYKGITIDSKDQDFKDDAEFDQCLTNAIPKWQEKGVRGLWVKIDVKHSSLVPVCAKHGFDFNHAQPGYVMMTKWLSNEQNRLPEYANQYLGVAGIVINDKGKMLVIQERFNVVAPHWKLPGGLADKGEDIAQTAKREVYEETGIEAEFVSVICFRHQHNFRFGCSDFYFVCLMKPVGGEIRPCPHEIAACKWIDVDEFLSNPHLQPNLKLIVESYKNTQKNGNVGIIPQPSLHYNKKSYVNIYSIQKLNQ